MFPDEKEVVRVTLVEANEILSAFDSRLRSYTERLISKRSSMNIVKAAVTSKPLTHTCGYRESIIEAVKNKFLIKVFAVRGMRITVEPPKKGHFWG